jgi:NADH dehydrogenase
MMLDRLAQELPPELGIYAQRNLESRGIEIWLPARVTAYESHCLRVHDGRQLEAETVIWTAGARPSPLIRTIEVQRPQDGDDRLPVNEYLQVGLGRCGLSAIAPGTGTWGLPAAHGACGSPGRHVPTSWRRSGPELKPRLPGIGMLATLGRYRGWASNG